MPRSWHMKSRYGAKPVIFYFFSPGPRPEHVESRDGANGVNESKVQGKLVIFAKSSD